MSQKVEQIVISFQIVCCRTASWLEADRSPYLALSSAHEGKPSIGQENQGDLAFFESRREKKPEALTYLTYFFCVSRTM